MSRSFEAATLVTGQTFNVTDQASRAVPGVRASRPTSSAASRPSGGRYFLPDETAESRVVVLTHGLWQARFAGTLLL